MLPRTLEPEVMESAEEADDYDTMDHGAVNQRFVDDLLVALAGRAAPELVLDVGTGTALIPIAMCARLPSTRVVAVDMSLGMLARARENLARAGVSARVTVEQRDAKHLDELRGPFDAVVSNSLVHHVPDAGDALREMWHATRPGGLLFVRDLFRPESAEAVRRMVEESSPPAPLDATLRARHARQVQSFEASLHAALTLEEVRAHAVAIGLSSEQVSITSDRHWTLLAWRDAGGERT